MRKTNKVLTTLAIAGMLLSSLPLNVFAEGTVQSRLYGETASQTAVAIAEQTGWTGTAILASSASYGMVDALTSGPLAAFLKAPIFLQEPGDVLNPDTKAELEKLAVTKVYVTSGTAVISQAVLNQLADLDITVIPLGGSDRFETSVNIAKKMVELEAPVTKVAVAYGWLNQDALSVAAIASANNEPILLTEKNTVPASVKAFLTTNTSIVATDVIGGTGVISVTSKDQFPSPTRYFGNTAYDTNVAVLKAFDNVINYDNVFIANGETAIDALAGAPLAAKYNAGIVLVNGTTNEGTTYASGKISASSVVTALGGTAVVPESVLNDIIAAQTSANQTAAIAKIDGIVLGEDSAAITLQDLKDAGVTAADVLEANLVAYQTAISAAADLALDSTVTIQEMVTDVNTTQAAAATLTTSITKIDSIVLGEDATAITLQDLKDAGVTAADVLEANLVAYQTAISAAADLALDSTAKIQEMVTDVNTAQAAAATLTTAITKIDSIVLGEDAATITLQDLKDAGVTAADVLEANLEAYQAAISAAADLALDSTVKIQEMVTAVNTAEAQV